MQENQQKGNAMPTTTDPFSWHAYIRAASSFADAQARIERAVMAGVDFAAMRRFQS